MVAIIRQDEVRTPPHSVEAEQAVLGGLMIDANAWDAVADIVVASDFYRRDHRLIFEAIAEVAEIRGSCDVVTISEHLERKGRLEEVGGLHYLGSIARDTPSAANVRAYSEIIRERSILRQLVAAGGEIAAAATDSRGRPASELVDEAERRVFEIAERGSRGRSGFRAVRDILPQTIDRLDTLHQSPGEIRGVPTGFTLLDRKTAGLQPGDLVVIAGRPSMGKSTLAVNIAESAAIAKGVAAGIFTMEMSAEQMTLRMISSLGRVNASHLRSGNFRTRIGRASRARCPSSRARRSTSTSRRRSRRPSFVPARAA
jgi:replicative DNA helicase